MKRCIQNDKTIFCFFLGSLLLLSAGLGCLMAAGKSYTENHEEMGSDLLTGGACLLAFGSFCLAATFFVFRVHNQHQQLLLENITERSPLISASSPLSINDPNRYESPRKNQYSSSAPT